MESKLIVALDFANQNEAINLAEKLNPSQCALKVGSEMFTFFGPAFVRRLIDMGFKVFLDLKFHDIPNTVAQACQACAELGVWMINVHAFGGAAMLQAARAAIEPYGAHRPLLIGVTVLTSLNSNDLIALGIMEPLEKYVDRLATLAYQSGLDGVVCSAFEAPLVKKVGGQAFLAVTPGIRMEQDSRDDQVRVVSPLEAINLGSDFLVIGRSITRAKDPLKAVSNFLNQIRN